MNPTASIVTVESIRSGLGRGTRGQDFWRSLDELADTPEFRRFVENEFGHPLPEAGDTVSRRDWLRLMSASLALAGFTGCTRQPAEKIVPYVRAPEEIVPGKPLYFATASLHEGYATGVLVESHMGRPTKVEGNPRHPASVGATDVFAQASALTFWDPDRSQVVLHRGRISSWVSFQATLNLQREAQLAKRGAGLRILTETVTSPTLAAQIRALLAEFPEARWFQYQAVGRDAARAGAKMAFGEYADTRYRFDLADVVVSLDADFLTAMPGSLRYARDFIARRKMRDGQASMTRLYAVEPGISPVGSMADHRLPMKAAGVEAFACALAAKLGVSSTGGAAPGDPRFVDAVAKDLAAHRGSSIVVPGEQQPAAVHALAHAMNHALGNAGKTVVHTTPVEASPVDHAQSLAELAAEMKAGKVDALIILGGNPVYTAPADLDFAAAIRLVKFCAHLSLYEDETSELCPWHLAEAHPLEAWSDARAWDGTITILQPLIAPLYGGRSAHEVLIFLSKTPDASTYDLVRAQHSSSAGSKSADEFWRTALHDGLIAQSAFAPKTVTVRPLSLPPAPSVAGSEIVFRPDPCVWDGSHANNGWLQELPKPLTKLTWDNAVLVSPATAQKLGVASEDVVNVSFQGRTVRGPVWITPGQVDDSITVHLGYGRRRAGRVGNGQGFDAGSLRTTGALWHGAGVAIGKTGEKYPLATTQLHHSLEGRQIIRVASLAEYREHPNFAQHAEHAPAPELTLYPEYRNEGYKWGMAIDTHACIGCNACTIACQAENNIAVVGKTEVARGREMHWIRVDRYHRGELSNPETYFQPLPCMQCENAPCEPVCPVAATAHSADGINQMVYNRCIGTRYCSNNCPYKVRRFNFFLYSDWSSKSLWGLRNPDVTVRSRGVMEKCTYCVQRINEAKIESEKEDRTIRDGEVLTACQQVCPTEAIVFGNLNDPVSRVAKLKADPRNYALLADLNTRPRTTYLARVRNPNPELETA